jgi:hypothetical protein
MVADSTLVRTVGKKECIDHAKRTHKVHICEGQFGISLGNARHIYMEIAFTYQRFAQI